MYFLIKISLPVVPVSFHLTLSTVPFLRCLCHYGICHGLRTLCDAFQSVRFYQFYYDICIPLVTISCFLMFLYVRSWCHRSALRMSFAEELAGSTAPFGFFDPLGFSTVSNLLQVTSHPNHNKSTISSPFFFSYQS